MTTQTEIRKVGIAGAGTMGTGIAQVSALAGYEVVVYDIGKERIDLAGETVKNQLDKGVEKGKVTPEARACCMGLSSTPLAESASAGSRPT